MVFSVQTFDGSRGRCLNTRPREFHDLNMGFAV